MPLTQLEPYLFKAVDILYGKMDGPDFREYIAGILVLKRCSDVFDQNRQKIILNKLLSPNP
ncbi:type I restriction-modification system subunit M N-terminal domain-containing protein [Actimicrobium antarcticum]|uniref:N6 adenine-specific DNA methyltransferase N-terminal domain-containing protein n=1 Tax=Actimicrobium antarcticum TaxID=1051899 RepID=A0ABP7TK24_9BURK